MTKYILAFLAIFFLQNVSTSVRAGVDGFEKPLRKGTVVTFQKWLICDEQSHVEQILEALQKGEPTTVTSLFREFAKTQSKKHTGTLCAIGKFVATIKSRVAFFPNVSWTPEAVGPGYVVQVVSHRGNVYYTFSSVDVIDFEL